MTRHRIARTGRTTIWLPAVAALLGLSAAVSISQADEQRYAERMKYDANTGEWIALAPPVPGTEDGDLELARSLLARGEYTSARKAFKAWFKAYPQSDRRPEGLFYAADVEVAAENAKERGGDLMQAYRWYEELLEGWPGTELADRALRRELAIAEAFLFHERKQKVWKGMFWLSATEEALKILNRIIDEWAAGSPVAEQALRMKADYHYSQGEFQEAEQAYSRLMRDFPRGKHHRTALLRSGESALARFPGVLFDDADLVEAEVYLTDFQEQYPKSVSEAQVPQMLARIHESRARKDYEVAEYYRRAGKHKAAVYYYRLVIRSWPDSTWAARSKSQLAKLGEPEPTPASLEAAEKAYEEPIPPAAESPRETPPETKPPTNP